MRYSKLGMSRLEHAEVLHGGEQIMDGAIENKHVKEDASIHFSKINMDGAIEDQHVKEGAAIHYSKINCTLCTL